MKVSEVSLADGARLLALGAVPLLVLEAVKALDARRVRPPT